MDTPLLIKVIDGVIRAKLPFLPLPNVLLVREVLIRVELGGGLWRGVGSGEFKYVLIFHHTGQEAKHKSPVSALLD